jgi:hypothetical protein
MIQYLQQEDKMKQRQAHIQQSNQGIVTVSDGEVPVIHALTFDLVSEILMAVNFLRSGCPAVQIFYPYHMGENENFQRAREILAALQLEKELFLWEVEKKDDRLCIITLTGS